jgi:2-amino-4-hydroxy-6-hydroxymethyldihydropteridine diphosphokinase
MGDRGSNLRAAISLLRERVHVTRLSSVYESEPVGYADQPEFWNMVVQVSTPLAPRDLLVTLIEIEQTLGRQRTVPNGPRIIDLDILLYGDVVHDATGLTIPHPRMNERGFVLHPLVEVDAQLMHPVSNLRFADLLENGSFEKVERRGELATL